jgi:hypothetical protein
VGLEDLSMLFVCMNSIGKSFIIFTSTGSLTIKGCKISIAYEMITWEKEKRSWNGTFIILNNGSYSLIDTDFTDIFISGTNSFLLSSSIETDKIFNINNCIFNGCSIGNDNGSPLNIELKGGGLEIKDTKFINCISEPSKTQALYINGTSYESDFKFDNISLIYSNTTSEKIILLNFSDFNTLPDNILNNINFRSKFINLCDLINETNFCINNTPLKELICVCP